MPLPNWKFCQWKSPENRNWNFSCSALFHMKTKVYLKYFVNDCRNCEFYWHKMHRSHWVWNHWSSRREVFCKNGVLGNFANSQENTCVGVSFFNKVAGLTLKVVLVSIFLLMIQFPLLALLFVVLSFSWLFLVVLVLSILGIYGETLQVFWVLKLITS